MKNCCVVSRDSLCYGVGSCDDGAFSTSKVLFTVDLLRILGKAVWNWNLFYVTCYYRTFIGDGDGMVFKID